MITGVFYKGSDLPIILQTDAYLETEGWQGFFIVAKFPDGTVQEYEASIVAFSSLSATIPKADNTQAGEIFLQVKAVSGDGPNTTYFGETESLVIFDPFVVPP